MFPVLERDPTSLTDRHYFKALLVLLSGCSIHHHIQIAQIFLQRYLTLVPLSHNLCSASP